MRVSAGAFVAGVGKVLAAVPERRRHLEVFALVIERVPVFVVDVEARTRVNQEAVKVQSFTAAVGSDICGNIAAAGALF